MKLHSVGKRGKNTAQENSPQVHFSFGVLRVPRQLFPTTPQSILPRKREKVRQRDKYHPMGTYSNTEFISATYGYFTAA